MILACSQRLQPIRGRRAFSEARRRYNVVRGGGVACWRSVNFLGALSPWLVQRGRICRSLRNSKLGAIDRSWLLSTDRHSMISSVQDDDVAIMGQLQDEDYVADVVPTTSQNDSNKEIDDGPLPTSSEVISALALVRRYCVNMEGCGLSCSGSLHNVEACVLSQAAKSLKQKKIQDYFVPK
ncbi:hypothetical protein HPB50_006744 [Hyalomma asiaticum]|uniref:Uncharacterized protein n=1 Tax=Hyalomma asiaticum TaxID=266040 RepID=A0ACB7TFY3_HYAAI|nr:hypothetical protein HPB50_006744 [Hyalomma asiaticum]